MSDRDHDERAVPEPGTGIEAPRFATHLNIDLADVTEADVIVFAMIFPRRTTETRERGPSHRHPIGWRDLTDRERAVAGLAGRALTNQQIANRLGISPHTVNFHLRQIFRKLGIESRVQLASLPADHA